MGCTHWIMFSASLLAVVQSTMSMYTNGSILSPNYPNNYNSSTIKHWFLTAPQDSDKLIALHFNDFLTEQDTDFVYVFNFTSWKMHPLKSFSGHMTDIDYYTDCSHLTVSFQSTSRVNRRGFNITWSLYSPDSEDTVLIPETGMIFSMTNASMDGWTQATDDDFDWSFSNHNTPSDGTGPTCPPYPCSSDDYYAFINTSAVGTENNKAILLTKYPYSSESGCINVTLFYHGFGDNLGELRLFYASSVTPSARQYFWTAPKSSSLEWQLGKATIRGRSVIIGIQGTRGTSQQGIYAFSDVGISDCFFSKPKTTTTTTTTTVSPYKCGTQQKFYSDTGVIRSPAYPNDYPHSCHLTWVITLITPGSNGIDLIFEDFETEFNHDTLQIWSLSSVTDQGQLLHTFSGRLPPKKLVTTNSDSIRLEFTSDAFLERKGFSITWTVSNQSSSMDTKSTCSILLVAYVLVLLKQLL